MVICKKCKNEHDTKYREENREKVARQAKEWYENNKEKRSLRAKENYIKNKATIKEKSHEYYQAHLIECNRKSKLYRENNKAKLAIYYENHKKESAERGYKYRAEHKEEIKISNRKYAKENVDKINVWCQRYCSKKRKLPSTLTIEQWENVKLKFSNKCCYCGKELPLTQEHFLAVHQNGEYTLNNIIPACQSCNSSKGSKNFFEWYPKHKHYSKKREKTILEYLGYENNNQQLKII